MSELAKVIITQEGRSGSVTYQEGPRRITGWWEFAGGDAIAIVYLGNATEFEAANPWAAGRRSEIFRFVADEVIRQQCANCEAEIAEQTGWITVRARGTA